ncbi:MAG: hypothetical protein DMG79_18010 [Acidobacteria bacterium]|nr:MAG: hypothetical protein DMG79_18010 [Acidobacteriota bacterium]
MFLFVSGHHVSRDGRKVFLLATTVFAISVAINGLPSQGRVVKVLLRQIRLLAQCGQRTRVRWSPMIDVQVPLMASVMPSLRAGGMISLAFVMVANGMSKEWN